MEKKKLKLAVLCSFNLDLMRGMLLNELRGQGIEAELYFSHYGQWETDALDHGSGLYRFEPDVVILFAEMQDLAPTLAVGDMLPTEEKSSELADAAWRRLDLALDNLLKGLPGPSVVMVHNFVPPPLTALGLLEGNGGYSYNAAAERLNSSLRERCKEEPRLVHYNYMGLVTDYGWRNLYDRRLWHLGRMRLNRQALQLLAAQYNGLLQALYTPRRKCLVLDLDNTLWGGIIGEDGLSGLELGHQGAGLAYREFQLAALALGQRGVILAVCTKNNPAEAMMAINEHPDMALRAENFACLEIGWAPKHEGLQRIAQRLNIGLDSLVFWDDNPLEREIVRSQLPQVFVPEVPDDVSDYASYLLSLDCFSVLSLTAEDRKRGELYRGQAQRDSYLSAAAPNDLESFYNSLETVARISEAAEFSLSRIAQLTYRTNQFNFTTRRYTEADVRRMYNDPVYRIYSLSLRDRFGDLGLVGAAIVRLAGESEESGENRELDTFLMSCRALGRRVEDTFLAFLAGQAGAANAHLTGTFIPTAKNTPAAEFLERLHLIQPGEGAQSFIIGLQAVPAPAWIRLEEGELVGE